MTSKGSTLKGVGVKKPLWQSRTMTQKSHDHTMLQFPLPLQGPHRLKWATNFKNEGST
jgi:hypothetical protein